MTGMLCVLCDQYLLAVMTGMLCVLCDQYLLGVMTGLLCVLCDQHLLAVMTGMLCALCDQHLLGVMTGLLCVPAGHVALYYAMTSGHPDLREVFANAPTHASWDLNNSGLSAGLLPLPPSVCV